MAPLRRARARFVATTASAAVCVALSPAGAMAQAPARPRLELAIGMGASFDGAGLSGVSAVPAFLAMGGFGDGLIGADFGVFANSATGRFRAPNVPVDRLALDGMVVVRPGARRTFAFARTDPVAAYGARILRAAAVEFGLGFERDSRITSGPQSVDRFGARLGAHLDVPLTPASDTSELRLRLAVRRFLGASSVSFPGGDAAPDSRAELFAALAAVF